jgi:predicted porin
MKGRGVTAPAGARIGYSKFLVCAAKRSLACTVAGVGLAASAQAADLPAIEIPGITKDVLPDTLTWNGITLLGAIDVGYAFQTNGRPLGSVISGLEFIPFTTTRNYTGQSVSTIAHGGLQQSFIGLKIEEQLGLGWTAIGRLDTAFDPLRGTLSDGCRSFVENAGLPYNQQNSNADSGRCGQILNGNAYGGVSNAAYGTLTFGRQATFQLDAIAAYDPMELSYAFSLLGYSGTDAGSGSTQAARWDNSVKYRYEYGPVHAGAMFSNGGSGTGMFGTGYAFNVGGTYNGFSLDGVYTVEHGAVNLQTSVNDVAGVTAIAANISDNETWGAVGKYTYDFSSGLKGDGPGAKLTFYAGYTHIDQSNPRDPVTSANAQAAGGYALLVADNNAFTTDKILQILWTGAKYELPSGWSFTAAYYHASQNSYVADGIPCTLGGASRVDCAGSFDQGSFVVDYRFNKHFDVYAGVSYARVDNGLAAGFPGTPGAKTIGGVNFTGTATSVDTTDFMTGVRLRF